MEAKVEEELGPQGEARAAWKRECRDGDAGSCWRVALLHYVKRSASSASDQSSKSLRRPSSPSADANAAAVEGDSDVEAEVAATHQRQQAPPLPNDKKAAKYAKRACTDDAGAEGTSTSSCLLCCARTHHSHARVRVCACARTHIRRGVCGSWLAHWRSGVVEGSSHDVG
jgi:hypothetical protein